jgi:hypothetical protein
MCLFPHCCIQHILYCVVFLFCFSSSCVPYIASFSGLSICDCPFGILGYNNAETNTYSLNMKWALIQTTEGNDDPNIIVFQKSEWSYKTSFSWLFDPKNTTQKPKAKSAKKQYVVLEEIFFFDSQAVDRNKIRIN